jgi:hypothetical protein
MGRFMSTVWQQLTLADVNMILSRALQHEIDQEIIQMIYEKEGSTQPLSLSPEDPLKLYLYLEPEQLDWCGKVGCMICQVQETPTQLGFTFETRDQAMQFLVTWQPQGDAWWIAE